jgi:hypothetical protein
MNKSIFNKILFTNIKNFYLLKIIKVQNQLTSLGGEKKKKRNNKTSTNEITVNVSENHSEKLIFRQKEGFEISRGQHGELIVNCQLI